MTGFGSKRQAALDKLFEVENELGLHYDQRPEPVAIHQHRIPYCADWYDGVPDHHDGHGPYEVRTLYTAPPKRPWVGLTDEELVQIGVATGLERAAAQMIDSKLKEKNFD